MRASRGRAEDFPDGSELTVREVLIIRALTRMACIGASESVFICWLFATSGFIQYDYLELNWVFIEWHC